MLDAKSPTCAEFMFPLPATGAEGKSHGALLAVGCSDGGVRSYSITTGQVCMGAHLLTMSLRGLWYIAAPFFSQARRAGRTAIRQMAQSKQPEFHFAFSQGPLSFLW